MKNIMPEVAALLGVEIGEEFGIEGNHPLLQVNNSFKFTENSLIGHEGGEINYSLYHLLTGEWTIIKKPWKPKSGDIFYYVSAYGEILSARYYDNNSFHYAMFYTGNCFRTEQEAEANREAIMEKFGWK